jgi:hypothetical protein
MVDALCVGVSEENVLAYYNSLFPVDPEFPEEDSLLNPRPDPVQVTRIVEVLDVSSDGIISLEEVKLLFSLLLGVPVQEIPNDHKEVVAFAGLSSQEMVTRLCETVPKAKVEEYYAAMFPAGYEPPCTTDTTAEPVEPLLGEWSEAPDKEKISRIVQALDTSGDGILAVSEVKALFSNLLEIPVADIPDDHKEVIAFAGLSTQEMIEVLMTTVTRETVERYHAAMFPPVLLTAVCADRAKVTRLVDRLDSSGDGRLSRGEVVHLFAKLYQVEPEDIPSDQKEVQAFTGMATEALVNHLCTGVDKDLVDQYYDLLFAPELADPAAAGSGRGGVGGAALEAPAPDPIELLLPEPPPEPEPDPEPSFTESIQEAVEMLPKAGAVHVASRGHFEGGKFVEQSYGEEEREVEWEKVEMDSDPALANKLHLDYVKKVEDIVHEIQQQGEETNDLGQFIVREVLKKYMKMTEKDIPPDHEKRAVGFAGLVHSICVTCPNRTVDEVYQEMFPGKLDEEHEKEVLAATLPSPQASPSSSRASSATGSGALAGLDEDGLRTHFVSVFGGWNIQVEEQVTAVLNARERTSKATPAKAEQWSDIDTRTMGVDELRTYYAMLAGGWNLFVEGKVKETMAMRNSGRMP